MVEQVEQAESPMQEVDMDTPTPASQQEEPQQEQSVESMPDVQPSIPGDNQSASVQEFLRRKIEEDEYNGFCADFPDQRVTHCNISFGTFICEQAANELAKHYSNFECYIKPIEGECYDSFQLACMANGGNKKLYDFFLDYEKERAPLDCKYSGSSAIWYRKRLSALAKGQDFTKKRPAKNFKEEAKNAGINMHNWATKMDNKLQVSDNVTQAGIIVGNYMGNGLNKFATWVRGGGKNKNKADQQA